MQIEALLGKEVILIHDRKVLVKGILYRSLDVYGIKGFNFTTDDVVGTSVLPGEVTISLKRNPGEGPKDIYRYSVNDQTIVVIESFGDRITIQPMYPIDKLDLSMQQAAEIGTLLLALAEDQYDEEEVDILLEGFGLN